MLDYLISRVAVADVLVDSVRTGSVQARIILALVDVDLAVGSGEAGAVAKARERVGPVHARAVVQARLRLEQMTSKEIKYLNNNL